MVQRRRFKKILEDHCVVAFEELGLFLDKLQALFKRHGLEVNCVS